MATKSTRIKQYIASYNGKVEVINFRPFQAETIGAKLTEDGLLLKDAQTLVENWSKLGGIKFELHKSK